MGLQRFGHNWATGQEQLLFMYNRPTTGALTCARFEQLCSDMRQGFKHSTGCNRGISLATMLPLSRNLRSRLCPLDLPPHPATPEAGSVLCICCLTPGISGPGLSASKAVGGRWLYPGGSFCVWIKEITEEIIEHQESLSDSERGSQIFVTT